VALQARQFRPAVALGGGLHGVVLVAVHLAGTQRADFALPNQLVQSLHGLLDGCGIVEAVHDVQIEVVGLQTAQAAFDLPTDRRGGEMAFVEVDLAGDDHLLARNAKVSDGPPDEFFAGAPGVAVRRVDGVETQVEGFGDDRLRALLARRPHMLFGIRFAEGHASNEQCGHLDA
jgi:hypothetical protein